jgi:dipeptidyl aminopeptidase/acylaminoacyl peptidase
MRTWRVVLKSAACYSLLCALLAIPLGELPFHTLPNPVNNLQIVQSATSTFGAVFEDVSITSMDGVRLEGWVARPAHANGNAVILLHGVGDSRQGMLGFARLFLSQGYMVLLPDSRGHGTSGGFPTYGIREAGDVRQWVGWLCSHEKPRCAFGMGESMGAAILLQATKEVPFCAVVAESPFASFREIAYIRVGQFFNAGDWVGRIALRPAVEFAFLYGWMTRGVQLAHASPALSVVGSRVPILLIHGLADTNIPFQQSETILAHNPSYITLWEVPGAGHIGASRVAGWEFDTRVLDWFASHGGE